MTYQYDDSEDEIDADTLCVDSEYIDYMYNHPDIEFYDELPLVPSTITLCNIEVYHLKYMMLRHINIIEHPDLYGKNAEVIILIGYRPGCNKLEKFKVPSMLITIPDIRELFYRNFKIPNIIINTGENFHRDVMKALRDCYNANTGENFHRDIMKALRDCFNANTPR